MSGQIVKFKPSNFTQGSAFVADWCGTCERGRPGSEPCDIVARSMWLDVKHRDYPEEWQVTAAEGAICTAHVALGRPAPDPRCDRTVDMFPDGPQHEEEKP